MIDLTKENLAESVKQIESMIKKINFIHKDNLRPSQKTLIEKRLVALEISFKLINEQLKRFQDIKKQDIIEILGEKNLANATGFTPYKSIVFCVIDAIFSIRTKYNPTTINVLERTAKDLGLNSRFDEFRVNDFIDHYGNIPSEELATRVFANRQRTSASNGILKADAVKEALIILNSIGINTIKDFNMPEKRTLLEPKWSRIKGQSSGVTWRYLCMLAGDQNKFKDDTHIYNFFINRLGYSLKTGNDYEKLRNAFNNEYIKVSQQYPGITIAVLDHMIWKYMSGN